jgi:hypothetical protein
MVAQVCNPSYSRGRHQEDCGSRTAQTNSNPHPISTSNLGMMVHDSNSTYARGKN